MALQKAVKKVASVQTIALSHIEKFIFYDRDLRLFNAILGINPHRESREKIFSASGLAEYRNPSHPSNDVGRIGIHCLRSRPGNLSMAWHQRQVIVNWRPTMEVPDDHRGKHPPVL
jgi:hypothetical protein